MVTMPDNLVTEKLKELALIWDPEAESWVKAYRRDFKRQKSITLIDTVTLDDSVTSFTGTGMDIRPYKEGLVTIRIDVANAPTDVVIDIEFSDNNFDYYKYMQGPFGDLRYEDGAGNKKECLPVPAHAPFIRAKITGTGTTSSATFIVTVKFIANS